MVLQDCLYIAECDTAIGSIIALVSPQARFDVCSLLFGQPLCVLGAGSPVSQQGLDTKILDGVRAKISLQYGECEEKHDCDDSSNGAFNDENPSPS